MLDITNDKSVYVQLLSMITILPNNNPKIILYILLLYLLNIKLITFIDIIKPNNIPIIKGIIIDRLLII